MPKKNITKEFKIKKDKLDGLQGDHDNQKKKETILKSKKAF